MITDYFEAPLTLVGMRASCAGPYLDDLATALASAGYGAPTIKEHLRTVVQFARWTRRRGIPLANWDESVVADFRRHQLRRKLTKAGRVPVHLSQFFELLRGRGLIPPKQPTLGPKRPAILRAFADWMRRNRGTASGTLIGYQYALDAFVAKLGQDPAAYNAAGIQAFVIEQLDRHGRHRIRRTVTAIRSFLRYLVAEGQVRAGIEECVPSVPEWRLSSLPRYLEAPDLQRVVDSCDRTTGQGLRDHAILLLLSRLGLRGGDVVEMMLGDIDWRHGTLRVRGKGRQEALLPLPQDVGDALLLYLQRGRPKSTSERLFLTVNAPTRPFASSASISCIVRFALCRAGIRNSPSHGAHLLRHSAATAMLRTGATLETIATVLRHRSPQTTEHYAKVDIGMLQQVAQPWPGGASC